MSSLPRWYLYFPSNIPRSAVSGSVVGKTASTTKAKGQQKYGDKELNEINNMNNNVKRRRD